METAQELKAWATLAEGRLLRGSGRRAYPPFVADHPAPGSDDQGPSSLELFLVSLCGCAAGAVSHVLGSSGRDFAELSVRAEATRRTEHPTHFKGIRLGVELLSATVTEEELVEAVGLAESDISPVWNMIKDSVPVTFTCSVRKSGDRMEARGFSLRKAGVDDAPLIHAMQVEAFAGLLAKYRDRDLNPGAEELEKVVAKSLQERTDYYLILCGGESAGAVRVVRLRGGERCRISPIFVLPRFRGRGLARETFRTLEDAYHPAEGWELETILEEEGNCRLYESLGYARTGRIDEVKEGMHIVHYEKVP
ncbi:MAG: GNAT family N-acetyltransferase [Spirochaetaceae bacterium]|nr:GNAT family N-acetyltransferase [Spirochaetaceae bacterium]